MRNRRLHRGEGRRPGGLWAGLAALALVLAPGPARPAGTGPVAGEAGWVVDRVPADAPVVRVPRGRLGAGRLPGDLREAAVRLLRQAGGLLLVGETDPVGPRKLNEALGLDYARMLAHRLAEELGARARQLACASRGEAGSGEPGVGVYPWTPPPPGPGEPTPLAVLEPSRAGAGTGRLWVARSGSVAGVWAGAEGALWRVDSALPVWRLPVPAGSLAVAADVTGGPPYGARQGLRSREAPGLRVRVEARGPWTARVRARVPPGYVGAVLWAGGLPYPLAPGPRGEAEAVVALLPGPGSAWVEAVGPDGAVGRGPRARLPEGQGQPPAWLALVIWDGGGVDLDVSARAGRRVTRPAAPDPLYDPSAVPGVRVLFDGDPFRPHSLLAGWGPGRDPELLVTCYSDLDGAGTTAWVLWVERPGDPLEQTVRVVGPRRLSPDPLTARWRPGSLNGTSARAAGD